MFGSVGPYRLPITCDTGAEVTVVPVECVEPEQLTGEECELKAFNETKTTGKWCRVSITVGDTTFEKKAVTQPGDTIGWSACLSLDMADDKEGQLLLDKMRERAAMTKAQTLYLPPEVREGILLSGVLASEAVVVKARKKEMLNSEICSTENTEITQEPVQPTTVEAPEEVISEEVDEQTVDRVVLEKEESLVSEEAEGDASGGRACEKGEQEIAITGIRQGIPRATLAKDTKEDQSLQAVQPRPAGPGRVPCSGGIAIPNEDGHVWKPHRTVMHVS